MTLTFRELVRLKGARVLARYMSFTPDYVTALSTGRFPVNERNRILIKCVAKAKWDIDVTFDKALDSEMV